MLMHTDSNFTQSDWHNTQSGIDIPSCNGEEEEDKEWQIRKKEIQKERRLPVSSQLIIIFFLIFILDFSSSAACGSDLIGTEWASGKEGTVWGEKRKGDSRDVELVQHHDTPPSICPSVWRI